MKSKKSNASKTLTTQSGPVRSSAFKSVASKRGGSAGALVGAPTPKIKHAPRKSSTGGLQHASGSKKGK